MYENLGRFSQHDCTVTCNEFPETDKPPIHPLGFYLGPIPELQLELFPTTIYEPMMAERKATIKKNLHNYLSGPKHRQAHIIENIDVDIEDDQCIVDVCLHPMCSLDERDAIIIDMEMAGWKLRNEVLLTLTFYRECDL